MKDFFNAYRIPIICGGIGFLLAILFLTIGFLKAMLLVIFTVLGGYAGYYLMRIGFFDQFRKSKE